MKRPHSALESPEIRAKRAFLRQENAKYPDTLVCLPKNQWPAGYGVSLKTETLEVWRSNRFLVQVVQEKHKQSVRLSVNRAELNAKGDSFQDGITWDELMQIKAQCGRADHWAVEVYPPDSQTVNVANMRHLWLLSEPPAFAWTA